jgi:SRSO17 transposase
VTEKQIKQCRKRLERFLVEMLDPLGRRSRRHWGGIYVRGLLLDGERKSVGAMVPRLLDGNEQNLQQFVSQSPWLWEPLWRRLALKLSRALMPTAWVIDDTGFPKQGTHSVAVHRQYSATLGKTGNCQVAVSLHAAGANGSSALAWRLYLPAVWARDQERRRKAGVPAEATFRKKWELALDLVDLAVSWGLPPQVVLADAGYGDISEFRRELERRSLAYAVGITSQVRVWVEPPSLIRHKRCLTGRPPLRQYDYGEQKPMTVRAVAEEQPQKFDTVTWRQGSRGPMQGRFLARRVQAAHGYVEGEAPGKEVWLLIEWPDGEPQPTKYFLCDLPWSLSLKRLVDLAHGRWRIEQDYQQLKEVLGLDHFEGRSWRGWHHHVTMVMLGHAFLRLEQARPGKQSGWTLPHMRREVQWLLCTWTGVCCYCGAQIVTGCGRGP